ARRRRAAHRARRDAPAALPRGRLRQLDQVRAPRHRPARPRHHHPVDRSRPARRDRRALRSGHPPADGGGAAVDVRVARARRRLVRRRQPPQLHEQRRHHLVPRRAAAAQARRARAGARHLPARRLHPAHRHQPPLQRAISPGGVSPRRRAQRRGAAAQLLAHHHPAPRRAARRAVEAARLRRRLPRRSPRRRIVLDARDPRPGMTRVSIGMPVYNSRPAYFALQLEALLGQEWGDFELIVSDNGSNAESRALYEAAARRDRRIRYLRHDENRGAVFNFNFALAEARGEYFMWAADDDLYDRRFLARTVPLLDAHPHAVIASANMRFIDGAGAELRKAEFSPLTRRRFAPLRLQAMLARHAYMDIYALHRRAALERTRKHRPMFGGDYALVFEMLLQGTIERADEELFASRVHH